MSRQDKSRLRGISKPWKDALKTLFSKMHWERADLINLLDVAGSRNLIEPEALAMIKRTLGVSKIQVRDIMVPRVQMILVRHDDQPEEILKTVIASGHSRFPVMGEDNDEITGILLAKDLLAYFAGKDDKNFDIKDLMRRAIFVPESKRLNILLREFRASRNHMAVVIDEYSGVAGLVTIEDIIEEIIGEIEDEHDSEGEQQIQTHSRNRFTIHALTPIAEFNRYFNTELSDDEYDTIGGLILQTFGHLPKRGETIDFEGFTITVLRADKRKINLLRLTRRKPSNAAYQ